MMRLAYPLVLLAALAAGRAHAQDGDRYGPRPVAYPVGGAARPVYAPALRPAAPMLRTLSWPGKAELRPALAPALDVGAPMAPTAVNYALRSAAAPTGRFPSMAAYGASTAAPPLRPAAAPYANVPSPSTSWPAPTRPARRPSSQAAARQSTSAQPVQLTPSFAAPAPDRRPIAQAGGSNLPSGLAAPPTYVGPGPAYGPALAAQARDQARAAAAATADTLPPPTVGRYGYVGPGRAAPATDTSSYPPTRAPSAPGASANLGPPRPPAYARGYVLPTQEAANAQAAAVGSGATAARTADGVRRYSVHREYGMEPDPLPVPPQFFTATADLSAPETEAAAPRNSKAAVNAARLAASGG